MTRRTRGLTHLRFRKGGHGGSLKHNDWPPLAERWMRIEGLIPSVPAKEPGEPS
jgi:hypothetical protein